LELKIYPDGVLKKRCKPLRRVDDEVLERAEQMLEFMYEAEGLGLAAPQVGWCDRIVTLDVDLQREDPRIFVNPLIVRREGEMAQEEGCLSLPGVRVKVPRASKVLVVAYTLAGERLEIEAEGVAASAWQHEMDHLNGLLIIDRLAPTTMMTIRDRLKELEQQAASEG
jgi:peptide deformylase